MSTEQDGAAPRESRPDAVMASSADQGGASPRKRRLVFLVTGIVVLALAIWGAVVFNEVKQDRQARNRADQLIDSLRDADLPTPSKESIVDTFGRDGGMVCENPTSDHALARYNAMLSNGASGPGNRPIIADKQAVEAEALVIGTYCPDQLAKFTKHVDGLTFKDTKNES